MEILVLFILIWLISPLILGVVCIWLPSLKGSESSFPTGRRAFTVMFLISRIYMSLKCRQFLRARNLL